MPALAGDDTDIMIGIDFIGDQMFRPEAPVFFCLALPECYFAHLGIHFLFRDAGKDPKAVHRHLRPFAILGDAGRSDQGI